MSADLINVYCFPNGVFATCRGKDQVPEANGAWLLKVAETLEAAGINPEDAQVHLPDRTSHERWLVELANRLTGRTLVSGTSNVRSNRTSPTRFDGRSAKGRPLGFELGYEGSNPSLPTKME